MTVISKRCAEEGHENNYCRCAARNIADTAVKLERARIERELGAFVDSVGAPFGMFDAAAVLHIVRGEQ